MLHVGAVPIGPTLYVPPAGQLGHPNSMNVATVSALTAAPDFKRDSPAAIAFAPSISWRLLRQMAWERRAAE